MADTKITALSAITTVDPANDVLPIVDVSDTSMAASGTTKKITTNQILGASGTATLASATITGDLTVDTSTLKVTASTDTVTVGATTTDAKFRVVDANYNGLRIGFLPGTFNYNLYDATVHDFRTASVTPQSLYTFSASSAVWYDGSGSTRMTLNSTGLGLGGIAAGLERFVVFSGASKMMSIDTNGTFFADGGTGKGRVTIENSSATNSILSTTTLFGAYNILKTAASQHQWFIGGSTQAMTLDASGRLIINSSTFVTPTLNTNGELNFMATSNTNVRFSYRGTDGVTRTADITLA